MERQKQDNAQNEERVSKWFPLSLSFLTDPQVLCCANVFITLPLHLYHITCSLIRLHRYSSGRKKIGCVCQQSLKSMKETSGDHRKAGQSHRRAKTKQKCHDDLGRHILGGPSCHSQLPWGIRMTSLEWLSDINVGAMGLLVQDNAQPHVSRARTQFPDGRSTDGPHWSKSNYAPMGHYVSLHPIPLSTNADLSRSSLRLWSSSGKRWPRTPSANSSGACPDIIGSAYRHMGAHTHFWITGQVD